jgi:hypothetical protein
MFVLFFPILCVVMGSAYMIYCFAYKSERNGFLLPLIAVLIPIMVIMVVAYQSHVKQEALRAHRVYWNDLIIKAAEGVAEEAFRWLIDNPQDPRNKIFERLRNTSASAPNNINMQLTAAQLPYINWLKETFGNTDVITRVSLNLSDIKPLFQPVAVPPPSFNPKIQGQIYPEPSDTFGLLKAEIEANYRGLKRKFVVVRDLKAVNILPSVFGKFTLFVKEKRNGLENDWNQLKNSSTAAPLFLDSYGFVNPNPNSLNNPITLIHSQEDEHRTCNASEIIQASVSPPIPTAWNNIDLRKRGWVYFGKSPDRSPLQYYVFQPMHGDVKVAANDADLPAHLHNRFHMFYGGSYMLSDRSKLYYLLRDENANTPEWSSFFPNGGGFNLPASGLQDADNRPLNGWIAWQTRFGLMSLTKTLLQRASLYDILKNYYEHPNHRVGATSASLESPHASIILPMGDMYPLNSTTIADRRSPTLMLGAWLRFLQVGNIVQIDDDMASALEQNPPADWLAELTSPTNVAQPTTFYSPNFPITVDESANPPAITFDTTNDKLGWSNYANWAKVNDDRGLQPTDFAKVTYNVYTHILEKIGDPISTFDIIMTKMLLYPGMILYEQIINDNMRNALISLFVPGGKAASDPQRKLETFSAELASVLQSTDPTNGTPISSGAPNFGKSFFYQSTSTNTEPHAISGECISIKDMNGRQLALGSLGCLWPFSPSFVLPSPQNANFGYDLRQKTTFIASSTATFNEAFIKTENGKTYLDLRGGVVTVLGNDFKLAAVQGNQILVKNGGMIIASSSEVLIENTILMEDPQDTLVIATASSNKDIIIKAGTYEAYFISSGTLRRASDGCIKILGGLAVNHFDFRNTSSSIFYGVPTSVSTRQTIVWDSKYNIMEPDKYNRGIKIHLGKSMVYWADEKIE